MSAECQDAIANQQFGVNRLQSCDLFRKNNLQDVVNVLRIWDTFWKRHLRFVWIFRRLAYPVGAGLARGLELYSQHLIGNRAWAKTFQLPIHEQGHGQGGKAPARRQFTLWWPYNCIVAFPASQKLCRSNPKIIFQSAWEMPGQEASRRMKLVK